MNKTLVNKISNYLSNLPIDRAWIFGSYAREEEKKNSDIDILVSFLPKTKITLFQYVHFINDLQSLTGKKIDLVEDGQLKKFANEGVDAEKILIYERKASRQRKIKSHD